MNIEIFTSGEEFNILAFSFLGRDSVAGGV
jgi:hypothetical protein